MKICVKCGEEFPYWLEINGTRKNLKSRKFCLKCSPFGMHNTRNVARPKTEQPQCLYCGGDITPKYDNYVRKFCCLKCASEFRYKTYIERWLRNEENGVICGVNSGEQVSQYVKRWLIETRGNKCASCGWSKTNQFTKKIPLQVHHKDGCCGHTYPDNIELLCPNCHSLTRFFGGSNKGNGRKGRYKYAGMV